MPEIECEEETPDASDFDVESFIIHCPAGQVLFSIDGDGLTLGDALSTLLAYEHTRGQTLEVTAKRLQTVRYTADELKALLDDESAAIENATAAYSDAVTALHANLSGITKAAIDDLQILIDTYEIAGADKRNEAALNLIKTAYDEWLNDTAEPVHPNRGRALVSSIADALVGRTGNA